jgi:hypothetical protein
MEWFKKIERRDPAELLPETLPDPIAYKSQREYVRNVLANEVDLRANGTQFVPKNQEPERSLSYRRHINAEGSPSQTVAAVTNGFREPSLPRKWGSPYETSSHQWNE